jgi:hypothetical protein
MRHRKFRNSDRGQVEKRFQKLLSCWRSKLCSVGGRLIFINSVLNSFPMFMLSFWDTERCSRETIITDLDFFLQNDERKKNREWEFHLTS